MSQSSNERLHGLDALRGLALLLGVVLHASLAWLPIPIWPVAETGSPVAAVIFFVIHVFRMTAFFMIAGLFAHLMLSRKGWLGFLKDRSSRIAGPLLTFWTPVFAGFIAVLLWKVAIDNGGSLPTDGPPPPPLTAQTFPILHLWFLYLLMIFYVVVLAIRAPFAAMDRAGVIGRMLDRVTGLIATPVGPFVLAAPLAVALYFTPNWIAFLGIPTPDTGLLPNAAAPTGFFTAFVFGFLLDRRRDLLGRIERQWPIFLGLAAGATITALMLSGGPAMSMEPVVDAQPKAILAGVYALAAFASAFAAMALSLRLFSGYSAVRRYLADASYWVYIVHMPLVFAGQVLLYGLDWPWYAKFGAVIGGTLAICLVTYELLVRHTFLGKWLNGRRVPWRKPREEPALAPAE